MKTCPLCRGQHTLSQCPRWRQDKKPIFLFLVAYCSLMAYGLMEKFG